MLEAIRLSCALIYLNMYRLSLYYVAAFCLESKLAKYVLWLIISADHTGQRFLLSFIVANSSDM